jgi:hypothetical protein
MDGRMDGRTDGFMMMTESCTATVVHTAPDTPPLSLPLFLLGTATYPLYSPHYLLSRFSLRLWRSALCFNILLGYLAGAPSWAASRFHTRLPLAPPHSRLYSLTNCRCSIQVACAGEECA